jgi:hypothetical protein
VNIFVAFWVAKGVLPKIGKPVGNLTLSSHAINDR